MFSLLKTLFFSTYAVYLADSHMILDRPFPYGRNSLNNSPLNGDGSDFPCKQRPNVYDGYDDAVRINKYLPGTVHELAFNGTAVRKYYPIFDAITNSLLGAWRRVMPNLPD
jgi:hypothetical protein